MVSGWNCDEDIKTASVFAARKDKLALLEDALRLSTGTLSIEKLPVVSFEASGALRS